jgi:hypothetical protein
LPLISNVACKSCAIIEMPNSLPCGPNATGQGLAISARLMFADPPYNVRIDGQVGGMGSIGHREFAVASGEMTAGQFTNFLRTVFLTPSVAVPTEPSTSCAWTGGISTRWSRCRL